MSRGAYAGEGRYDKITGERTRPFCDVRDRVRHHYAVDTAVQFDDAMLLTRGRVASIRYPFRSYPSPLVVPTITEGPTIRPNLPPAPRVGKSGRVLDRMDAAILGLGLAMVAGIVARLVFG